MPHTASGERARDPARAAALTLRAAEHIQSNPDRAEALLREALAADLFHGPAHNNLGVIYLKRGDLYDAAAEFEWARKLLPGHPDPRLNLALTLVRAGRIGDAIETFDTALEVYPHHLPTIMALAETQLRYQRTDDRTTRFLEEIALRAPEPWRQWARLQMSLRGADSTSR